MNDSETIKAADAVMSKFNYYDDNGVNLSKEISKKYVKGQIEVLENMYDKVLNELELIRMIEEKKAILKQLESRL